MRIISAFRDYYDGVQAHGADRSVVYVRVTRELAARDARNGEHGEAADLLRAMSALLGVRASSYHGLGFWLDRSRQGHPAASARNSWELSPFIVAAAGRLYPGYRYLQARCEAGRVTCSVQHLYTGAEIAHAMGEEFMQGSCWHSQGRRRHRDSIDEFMQLRGSERLRDRLIAASLPVAVLDHDSPLEAGGSAGLRLVADAPLRARQFQRVLDTWNMYQELSMFVAGTMAAEDRPRVSTDEKYRILAAGFDLRTSFRHPVKPS